MADDAQPLSELERLRAAWGDCYAIADMGFELQATRREGHHRSPVLRARSVAILRLLILADFGSRGAAQGLSADGYRNGVTS